MVDGIENPYRTDRVADALFVGRRELVDTIAGAIVDQDDLVIDAPALRRARQPLVEQRQNVFFVEARNND